MLIICDHCGEKAESAAGKPYPEGWAGIGLKVYSYNEAGSPIGTREDLDLCPDCIEAAAPMLRR